MSFSKTARIALMAAIAAMMAITLLGAWTGEAEAARKYKDSTDTEETRKGGSYKEPGGKKTFW
jgi:hypothetical protein